MAADRLSDLLLTNAQDCMLINVSKQLVDIAADASNATKASPNAPEEEFHLLVRITNAEITQFLSTPMGKAWVYELLDRVSFATIDLEQTGAWLELLQLHTAKMSRRIGELQKEIQKQKKQRTKVG